MLQPAPEHQICRPSQPASWQRKLAPERRVFAWLSTDTFAQLAACPPLVIAQREQTDRIFMQRRPWDERPDLPPIGLAVPRMAATV
jgi:hypothetical protein